VEPVGETFGRRPFRLPAGGIYWIPERQPPTEEM